MSYRGEKPVEKTGVVPFSVRLFLDFIWTAAVGAAFSVFIYWANDGEFRWFSAAFCGAGFAVWHVTAGRVVVFFSEKIAAFLRALIRYTVVIPLAFAAKVIVRGGALVFGAIRFAAGATLGRLAAEIRKKLAFRRALERTERARAALAEELKFETEEGTRR